MIPFLQVVSISNNLKGISLIGDVEEKYLNYPGSMPYRIHVMEGVLIRFYTEIEGVEFIQKMIDDGVPFLDSERSYAYVDVLDFIADGRLRGRPVRSIWKNGEYVIES